MICQVRYISHSSEKNFKDQHYYFRVPVELARTVQNLLLLLALSLLGYLKTKEKKI